MSKVLDASRISPRPGILTACVAILTACSVSRPVGPTDYVGDNGAPVVYRAPHEGKVLVLRPWVQVDVPFERVAFIKVGRAGEGSVKDYCRMAADQARLHGANVVERDSLFNYCMGHPDGEPGMFAKLVTIDPEDLCLLESGGKWF